MKAYEVTFTVDLRNDGNREEIKFTTTGDGNLLAAIKLITDDPRAEFVSAIAKEI